MNAIPYESLRQPQINLNHAIQAFYDTRKVLTTYRDAVQREYHAKETAALITACNNCIDQLYRMAQTCKTLNDRLAYYERMRL